MSDLPRYACHKQVNAVKIGAIEYDNEGRMRLIPADECYQPIVVDMQYGAKHSPQVGGYYVVYDDGYQSFSPRKAFEDGYTLVKEPTWAQPPC